MPRVQRGMGRAAIPGYDRTFGVQVCLLAFPAAPSEFAAQRWLKHRGCDDAGWHTQR